MNKSSVYYQVSSLFHSKSSFQHPNPFFTVFDLLHKSWRFLPNPPHYNGIDTYRTNQNMTWTTRFSGMAAILTLGKKNGNVLISMNV